MKAIFYKRHGALVPYTEEGADALRRIKDGDILEVQFTRPRSQRHHKLFFAMLKIVQDNRDSGSIDELLDIIKIGVGHTNIILVPNIGLVAVPKSINFASMDQDQFNKFFNRAVDFIVADILPGIDKAALTAEVYNLAGIPMALLEMMHNEQA